MNLFRCVAALALLAFSFSVKAGDISVMPEFVKGWNLAGNSTAEAIDVRAVFGSYESQKAITSSVVSIWKWNGKTGRWAFYTPRMQNSALRGYVAEKGYDPLWIIRPGEGYWLNAGSDFSLSGAVAMGAEKLPLVKGWNLSAFGRTLAPADLDALVVQATGASATTYWAWEAVSQTWAFFAPSLHARGAAELKAYADSKGYIDFVSAQRKLSVGSGFWINSGAEGTVALPPLPGSTTTVIAPAAPTVAIELQPNVVIASQATEDSLVHFVPANAYQEGTMVFQGTPQDLATLKPDVPLVMNGTAAKVVSATVYPDGNGGSVTTVMFKPATLDEVAKSVSVAGTFTMTPESAVDGGSAEASGKWSKSLSQTVPLGDVKATLAGTLTLAPEITLDFQRSLGVVSSARAQLVSDVTLDVTATVSGAVSKTWNKELFKFRRWIPNQFGLPFFAVIPVGIGLTVAAEGSVTSGYVGNIHVDLGAQASPTGIVPSQAMSYGATAKPIEANANLTVSPFVQPGLQVEFLSQPLIGITSQLGASVKRDVAVNATAASAERCTTDSANWDLVATAWAELPGLGKKEAGIIDLHPELMAAKKTCAGIPIANAGPDRSELAGTTVQLYGTQSTPSVAGSLLTYAWTQVEGSKVVFDDPTSATPSFLAPDYPTRLKFELVVTDGFKQVSQPKAVTITLQYNPEVAAKKTLINGGAFWAAGEPWSDNCSYCADPLVVGADPTQVLKTWISTRLTRAGQTLPSGIDCISMYCTKEGPCYFDFNGNEPNWHQCTFGNLPAYTTTLRTNAPAGCSMGEIAVQSKAAESFVCQK